jgi:syntaxin 18
MLSSVRKPYLDVHARPPPFARASARSLDPDAPGDFAQVWTDVKYLNNEERDQIDMQARLVLARCAERVKAMEALEKRACATFFHEPSLISTPTGRSELVATETNPFLRLLPARLKHDTTTAHTDFVAAHNASVTWFLTRRLADASQVQRDMQEERVRRQTERSHTLGSGAGREIAYMSAVGAGAEGAGSGGVGSGGGSGSWLGNASTLASSFLGSPGAGSSPTGATPPPDMYLTDTDDDELSDVELSASQIQQFEAENYALLRSVEDTLAAVQQAETRLLEIGALQAELVTQLTRQTEITDQLFEDAVASSEYVERGNVQLREARRRAKDGRMWILLFLIGASLSLLFLHYY